jgi:hypothetical protein
MIKQFLKEPLWFKILISLTFLLSIILSSSDNALFQSGSKLAAAIFFIAYGVKLKRNRVIAVVFFALAVLCIILSVQAMY